MACWPICRCSPRCASCSRSWLELLADPNITDVLVSAPDQVWVEQRGALRRTEVRFTDPDAVRRLAQRLALTAGRRLDDASPFVDAPLPGGVRLHAVLPPIATGCTCISLRVLRPASHGLDQLERSGSVFPQAGALLRAIIAARLAFLVVGGTGGGNTTLRSRHTYRGDVRCAWAAGKPPGAARFRARHGADSGPPPEAGSAAAEGGVVCVVGLVRGGAWCARLEDRSQCGALGVGQGWGLGDEVLYVRGQGVGDRRGRWGGAVLTC
jgi:hypothetical protein